MAVVLIIDDSPTELHLFQNMLEKAGFDTLVADSGEEGLKAARTARPDCILMDLLMPGMTGTEVLEQLRSTGSTTPVVIITADIQTSVRDRCLELGAFAVVNKPLLFETLLDTVKEALGEKDK